MLSRLIERFRNLFSLNQRKLFLHVGPEKTGSSAIQALFEQDDYEEVLYPKVGRWSDGAHHKLLFSSKGVTNYGETEIEEWNELLVELDNEISGNNKNLLLSTEGASPDFLRKLRPLIIKYRFKVTVIYVVRDPLNRAASLYNQHVKDPSVGLGLHPDEYLFGKVRNFKNKKQVRIWKKVSSSVVVIPYRCEEPLVARFANIVGITEPLNEPEKIYNPSIGGHAMVAQLIVNNICKSEGLRRSMLERLLHLPHFDPWTGKFFPFSGRACALFIKKNKAEYTYLQKVLGNEKFKIRSYKQYKLSSEKQTQIIQFFKQEGLYDENRNAIDELLKIFL